MGSRFTPATFPASHGCVRLPHAFARNLFGVARVGATVHILAEELTADTALAMARGEPIAPMAQLKGAASKRSRASFFRLEAMTAGRSHHNMANAIYLMPSTRAFRRQGVKGVVAVNVDAEEQVLRFQGTDGGGFDLPMEAIGAMEVGVIYNRVHRYRTILRRTDGGAAIFVDGRFPNHYPAFVRHLALELARGGRTDRIRGGVPFLLSWGPFFVLLGLFLASVGPYGAIELQVEPMRDNLLVPGGIALVGLGLAASGLVQYLRRERPRAIATLEALDDFLP